MEFYGNPPRFRISVGLVVGNPIQRVKEMCSAAVSVVLGNIFSAILTFFFALVCFNFAFPLKLQIDVIASLLSGRLVRERIGPVMLSAVQSQMSAVEPQFEEFQNIFDVGVDKGLPVNLLDKIPKVTITSGASSSLSRPSPRFRVETELTAAASLAKGKKWL
ncbi:hypothetical protein SAY86_017031 [Trapa natans]|uniref:Uncharacterized protein n=1 Tax=Trapa natans TaxID=22666 RepID=A0AAN7M0U1_TRANT|nr:hypothetical protein SAY86_017031 [Trapa natans]